ncbi:MerR family transcriptional regulator [Streptomyces sp. NPDC026206]|uniref:MerR family transcriptional regulator n=1 Tax=Streptomyces sp. NPDC026206 TaxID=3157089 RepID=UPI0033EB34CC
MRISELSRRSGVPIQTIKYYLREGLLPPGRSTSATQAEYDEAHVRRLRLIRALVGVRGLTVSATKEVLAAVREQGGDVHQVLGLVLGARPAVPAGEEGQAEPEEAGSDAEGGAGSETEADALLAEAGWQVSPHSPAKAVINQTLETLRSVGVDYPWQALVPYAELAERTAALDLDQLEGMDDPLEQAERAMLLTILLEPALLALRRLAQEDASARRYGG